MSLIPEEERHERVTPDETLHHLDFSDGRCRSQHGRGLAAAIADALSASEATHCSCAILVSTTYARVGRIVYYSASDEWRYINEKGDSQP